MRALIYRGSRPSRSARVLARALGLRVNRRTGRSVVRTTRRPLLLVNWGSTQSIEDRPNIVWVNRPEAVADASNKLHALQFLHAAGVPAVDFTTNPDEARQWLAEGDDVVMERRMLRASAGRGISLRLSAGEIDPTAPLWTRYFKGSHEYRIHVLRGRVIDRQIKRLRERGPSDPPRRASQLWVRNYDNGWVFCRERVPQLNGPDNAALAAVEALGLDFGAVDIKGNQQGTRCAVLEVNTAPGLQGTTLTKYAEALKEVIG